MSWAKLCSYLRVVHKPHQASLLSVQYEVAPQELAAALVLLYVEETADAVLSVHVRHLAPQTFPGLPRPGEGCESGWEGELFLKDWRKSLSSYFTPDIQATWSSGIQTPAPPLSAWPTHCPPFPS